MVSRGTDRRREFHLYAEKVRLPTLHPGDIVIMDDLSSHGGRQLIRSAIRVFAAFPPERAARTVEPVCSAQKAEAIWQTQDMDESDFITL
jgi:hypothetical protein